MTGLLLFIQLKIKDFYPSIIEHILNTLIDCARQNEDIPEENIWKIKHYKIFTVPPKNEPWKNKSATFVST